MLGKYSEVGLGKHRTLEDTELFWYPLKRSHVPRGGCWRSEPSGDADPGSEMKQVSKIEKRKVGCYIVTGIKSHHTKKEGVIITKTKASKRM